MKLILSQFQTVANVSSIQNIISIINVFLLITYNFQLLHRTNESPLGLQILLFDRESSDGVRHSLIDVLCLYKLGVPDSAAGDEAEGRGFDAAGGGPAASLG